MKLTLNKKTVGGGFLLLLVLLIFCSKTVYNHNLPQINAVKPQNGRLSKLEMSSGLAAWAEIERVYVPLGGICGELLVKEGDTVEAGQPLLRMDFDREEAERRLREIAASRARLQIDLQNIQLRLDKLERSAGPEGYEADNLAKDIAQAQTALEDAQILFELGEISQRELTSTQETLENLYAKRNKAAADYSADAAAARLDLQAKQLELSNLSLQEEPYRRTLADYEAYTVITAPVDGQLLSLNAQKGARLNENALLAEIGAGLEFTVACNISLDNNFVLPGDTCELSNSAHVLKGTVSRINPTERGKTVDITLSSAEVTAGETFDIVFEKVSSTTYTLVPNGAVNQDNDGYFLYQVKRRDGMLGKEYYLERLNIYIGDSDSKNTAVIKGIIFFEPLVQTSNKPVEAGSVVKLTNVGDFIEE
jgi:multidrug efflux pump subunit AcrA (membrane-fusion protein)